ncbi:diguanylate cyclase [Kangiella sp. TOML190]|uniref:sensor domain-containing diguanylate cyclase n=1 Tax=Kangiella sp. TOML190 TaxID=2931351 RepID=UPI00203C06B2|nr:diguanylate cyclase [Kangiella sp. TOML190]
MRTVLRPSLKLGFMLVMLMASKLLLAQPHAINQLPYTLDNNWQACVQKTLVDSLDCRSVTLPEKIEKQFPDFDGYIFYRNQFQISEDLSKQSLGVYIKHLRDSDEFYINGIKVGTTGQLPNDFKKATLYSRYYFIPGHLLQTNSLNTIEIKVFNHARFGGIINQAPTLDTAESLAHRMRTPDSSMMFYIGIFLLIFLLQLFYYFAQRDHKEHLYFALLAFCYAGYIFTYTQAALHSGLSINILFRVNVFIFGLMTIVFCLFIAEFFRYQRKWWLNAILILVAITSLISLILLPLDYMYHQVILLDILGIGLFIPLYIYLFYRSIKERMPYAKTMALVVLIHLVTVIIDIMIDLHILPLFFKGIAGMISPISIMALFITISLILTHRHWLYYRHATYDYLTDALRRSAFMERLSEEVPRSQRLGKPLLIALMDIDDFKQINDQYTHVSGDQVLRELVRRIRSELREFDLLSRYGGDEFCMLAMVQDEADGIRLLKRIQEGVTAKPIKLKGDESITVSLTIGAWVSDPDDTIDVDELVSKADAILVQGKAAQKGKIHI